MVVSVLEPGRWSQGWECERYANWCRGAAVAEEVEEEKKEEEPEEEADVGGLFDSSGGDDAW